MTRVFGEVAALYDDVRPGYPDGVRQAILDYAGGPPRRIAEIGAGTGKGTELLLRLGAPLEAIEPDPRMAAVLRANFPQVAVANQAFEEWAPTAEPDLLACASAWHWLDPAVKHQHAADALSSDGVLAIFLNRYGYRDPALGEAIADLLLSVDPTVTERPPDWPYDEIKDAGPWRDVRLHTEHTYPELTRDHYLALTQTFGPFRRRSPELQQQALDGLRELLGETVVLDLRTVLVLARRS